jgi:hypothetical protein
MACGLAAVVAGAVIGEAEGGKLTGYSKAGIIAAASTAASMVLAGRLRVAEEVPETSAAVDSLGATPALAEAKVSNPCRT